MYSLNSPSSVLSSISDNHHANGFASYANNHHQTSNSLSQCLKFKYFTTFLICTTCLALLSASLATHKWIVSKPIRVLKLNGNQTTNLTSLMLTAQMDDSEQDYSSIRQIDHNHPSNRHLPAALLSHLNQATSDDSFSHHLSQQSNKHQQLISGASSSSQNNKFQGEIHFGLFQGVKVLNYGFGDRISHISVVQNLFAKDRDINHQELINYRSWLATVSGVVLAILFALIGSIFAIINFVMTPRGSLTGPIGLVIYNSAACFSCLLAIVSWLVEYFIHLKTNVLTAEEVANGWTSENRSQFGYSFYFIILSFILHLVNIFIISLVQFEQWSQSHKLTSSLTGTSLSSKSQARLARQQQQVCEGVIMLY